MRGITVRLPTITDPGAPLPPPSDHDEARFVDITQHTDQVAPTQWDSTPLDQSPTPTTMADGPTTSGSNEFRLPRIIDRQEAARLKQADFAGRATELDDLAKRRGRMFPTKRTELQQTRSHGYLHVRENRRKSTGGLLTLASDLDALMTVRRQHKMPTTMMGENGTQSVLTTRVPATHSFPFRTKKVPSVQSAPPVLVVSPGTSPIARNGGHAEVSSRSSLPDVFWSARAKPVNEAHAGSNRQARTRHASYRSRSMSPARRLDNEYAVGNIGPDLLTLQSISPPTARETATSVSPARRAPPSQTKPVLRHSTSKGGLAKMRKFQAHTPSPTRAWAPGNSWAPSPEPDTSLSYSRSLEAMANDPIATITKENEYSDWDEIKDGDDASVQHPISVFPPAPTHPTA